MRGLVDLPDTWRLAAVGVLLCAAGSDGVIDDDELFPLIGDLAVHGLGPAARALVAGWFAHPPTPEQVVGSLAEAPWDVRAGLLLRVVEVLAVDGVLGGGEVRRATELAAALGLDDDQLGALRAFVADLGRVDQGLADPAARERVLRGAGSTLRAAGLPPEALRFSGLLEGLEGLGPLLAGLEAPADLLGDARARARERASRADELRSSLEALLGAMEERERGLDEPEATAAGVRRRALERRLRPLSGSRPRP